MSAFANEPPTPGAASEAGRHQVWRRVDTCRRWGEPKVQAQLDARRWQSPMPNVVVGHNGPLSREQQLWTVLLGGPPGMLLHGLTALQYDGLRNLSPDRATFVVPAGLRIHAPALEESRATGA